MALTVAKAQRLRASHTFAYAGEPVTVDYYPARAVAITQETLEAWARETVAAAEAGGEEALRARGAALWSDVIAAWDVLLEEGGAAVPLDDWTALFSLGPHFLVTVLAECIRAAWDAKPRGTAPSSTSGATSAPEGATTSGPTEAPSRNTTKRRSSRSKSASRPGN